MSDPKTTLAEFLATRQGWHQRKKKNGTVTNSWRKLRPNGTEVLIWAGHAQYVVSTKDDAGNNRVRNVSDLGHAVALAEQLATMESIPVDAES